MPDTTSTPATAFEISIPNRFINVVLLGTDLNFRRLDGTWRTDSIIIASVDVEDGSVGLLHVPRDLWVYIPEHGNNRINTADLWGELDQEGGGPERVKETIHHNLGIPIHYYVKMHREGFKQTIDTLGGVDVDVACPLPELNLEAGMHHFDGELAYEFVHTRETSSDYDRGRRQRKMLMALWEQALTPDIITKLPKLWISMGDTFETDIPMDEALNLARLGLQIDFQDIDTMAISGKQTKNWTTPDGQQVLLPRQEQMRILLEGFYDTDPEPKRQEERGKVRLQVLNGTNRPDAEQLAAAELKREGFKIVGKDIAGQRDYARTQIIVRRASLAAGERIARELGVSVNGIQDETNVPDPPRPSDRVDIKVILGKDYDPCQR
jgi:LCP family protein required for cell wall assembly